MPFTRQDWVAMTKQGNNATPQSEEGVPRATRSKTKELAPLWMVNGNPYLVHETEDPAEFSISEITRADGKPIYILRWPSKNDRFLGRRFGRLSNGKYKAFFTADGAARYIVNNWGLLYEDYDRYKDGRLNYDSAPNWVENWGNWLGRGLLDGWDMTLAFGRGFWNGVRPNQDSGKLKRKDYTHYVSKPFASRLELVLAVGEAHFGGVHASRGADGR